MIVELLSVPDCPNLDRVRAALHTALAELSLSPAVVERVGDHPSPSVLIDGVDAMGAGDGPAACRLDLPTVDHFRAALRHAAAAYPFSPTPTAHTLLRDSAAGQPGATAEEPA